MKYLVCTFTFFALLGSAHAQSCPTPSQLDTDLTAASQAATISLSGINPVNCPEVAMTQTWSGGKLIFSDSPETPTTRGKLYDDATLPATVSGSNNRVFLYHVNGNSSKMKFTVLVKNLGTASATLTTQQSGTAGPTTSYLYAGKVAFNRWTNSSAGTPQTVAVGAWARMDSTFDATSAAQNNLMHGIWDYQMTQPHEILICALNANDDPIGVCPGLSLLSRDTHNRGTFPYADKIYDTASGVVVDTAAGVQQFSMAGGTVNDDYTVGTDVTDGTQQTLKGNFGVLYRSHIAISSSDGLDMGVLINPRGGAWGGAIYIEPGIYTTARFLIPPTTGSNSDSTKASVAGRYVPGSAFTVWFQFMPTGGSSFPLRWVMVPH